MTADRSRVAGPPRQLLGYREEPNGGTTHVGTMQMDARKSAPVNNAGLFTPRRRSSLAQRW
jgi:hypothetical protein